jgi:hypothetical protein
LRLITTVPALDARYAGEERTTIDLIARLLADRTGTPITDFQLQLTAAALVAVLFTSARRWAAGRGAAPMAALLDQAVTTVEPLLARLERLVRRPLLRGCRLERRVFARCRIPARTPAPQSHCRA